MVNNQKFKLNKGLAVSCLILALLPLSLQAKACAKPERPALPDVQTAVTAEMVKAQRDVKKFMAAAQKYLGCAKSSKKHNAMVDAMHDVGDNFNSMIKEYKALQKSK